MVFVGFRVSSHLEVEVRGAYLFIVTSPILSHIIEKVYLKKLPTKQLLYEIPGTMVDCLGLLAV